VADGRWLVRVIGNACPTRSPFVLIVLAIIALYIMMRAMTVNVRDGYGRQKGGSRAWMIAQAHAPQLSP
jgi:hypothetical protein